MAKKKKTFEKSKPGDVRGAGGESSKSNLARDKIAAKRGKKGKKK